MPAWTGDSDRTSSHTCLGGGLAPVGAHPSCDVEDDRQVVARPGGWLDRLAHALDAPLRVGDRALALGPGRGRRQHDVRELRGLGQEQVLDDEQLEALEQADRARLVRLGLDRVLADAVHGGQVAALHRVEHAGQVPAALAAGRSRPMRRRTSPGASSFSTCWKPGSRSGRAPMSPPPWTLFWPRSGLTPLP